GGGRGGGGGGGGGGGWGGGGGGRPAAPPHPARAGVADPAGRAGDDGDGPIGGAWRHASSASATTAARLSVPPAGAPRRKVRQTIRGPSRPPPPALMRPPHVRYQPLKAGP